MFSVIFYALFTLSAVQIVASLAIPRASPPAGWKTDVLEPYTAYHARYVALGCQNQHGMPFFDQCCHPLLATEKLETARPHQCNPSAVTTLVTSVVATPTTIPDDGDEDCTDDEDDTSTSILPPVPTSTHALHTTTAPSTTSRQVDIVHSSVTVTHPSATPVKPPASDNASSAVNKGGFATYFYQGGVAGACGTVHSDNDMIAAMDYRRYGNLNVKSPLCGKQVQITNPANGKSVRVTIADACPTCENNNSIDLSEGAFKKIATLSQGMVPITWTFV